MQKRRKKSFERIPLSEVPIGREPDASDSRAQASSEKTNVETRPRVLSEVSRPNR
jgi:hypothetical protein